MAAPRKKYRRIHEKTTSHLLILFWTKKLKIGVKSSGAARVKAGGSFRAWSNSSAHIQLPTSDSSSVIVRQYFTRGISPSSLVFHPQGLIRHHDPRKSDPETKDHDALMWIASSKQF
jgi:hypothetical protein